MCRFSPEHPGVLCVVRAPAKPLSHRPPRVARVMSLLLVNTFIKKLTLIKIVKSVSRGGTSFGESARASPSWSRRRPLPNRGEPAHVKPYRITDRGGRGRDEPEPLAAADSRVGRRRRGSRPRSSSCTVRWARACGSPPIGLRRTSCSSSPPLSPVSEPRRPWLSNWICPSTKA
jgi:hypothetical protein